MDTQNRRNNISELLGRGYVQEPLLPFEQVIKILPIQQAQNGAHLKEPGTLIIGTLRALNKGKHFRPQELALVAVIRDALTEKVNIWQTHCAVYDIAQAISRRERRNISSKTSRIHKRRIYTKVAKIKSVRKHIYRNPCWMALMFVFIVLRKIRGYNYGTPESERYKVTHLYYMDDLKLYTLEKGIYNNSSEQCKNAAMLQACNSGKKNVHWFISSKDNAITSRKMSFCWRNHFTPPEWQRCV